MRIGIEQLEAADANPDVYWAGGVLPTETSAYEASSDRSLRRWLLVAAAPVIRRWLIVLIVVFVIWFLSGVIGSLLNEPAFVCIPERKCPELPPFWERWLHSFW